MAEDIEARFECYCEAVVSALAHADRREPARWYLEGMMLPGGRDGLAFDLDAALIILVNF